MDELNMDCKDVEKFYSKKPTRPYCGKSYSKNGKCESTCPHIRDCETFYVRCAFDQWESYCKILLQEYQESLFKNGMVVMKDGKIVKLEDFFIKDSICDTAPYPQCNGAEGCDSCEHQEGE